MCTVCDIPYDFYESVKCLAHPRKVKAEIIVIEAMQAYVNKQMKRGGVTPSEQAMPGDVSGI
jgi:hypothetical protein